MAGAKVRRCFKTNRLLVMWNGFEIRQPLLWKCAAQDNSRVMIDVQEGMILNVRKYSAELGWYEVYEKGKRVNGSVIWEGPKLTTVGDRERHEDFRKGV